MSNTAVMLSSTPTYYANCLTVFYVDIGGVLRYVQANKGDLNAVGWRPEQTVFNSNYPSGTGGQIASSGVYALLVDGSAIFLFFTLNGTWQYTYGTLSSATKATDTENAGYTISWTTATPISNIPHSDCMITAQAYAVGKTKTLFVLFANGDGGQLAYLSADISSYNGLNNSQLLEGNVTELESKLWSGPGSLRISSSNEITVYYKGNSDSGHNPIYTKTLQITSTAGTYSLVNKSDYKTHNATSDMPWPIYFNGRQFYFYSGNRGNGQLWWGADNGALGDQLSNSGVLSEGGTLLQGPSAGIIGNTLYGFYLAKGSTALNYYCTTDAVTWNTGQNSAVSVGTGTPAVLVNT